MYTNLYTFGTKNLNVQPCYLFHYLLHVRVHRDMCCMKIVEDFTMSCPVDRSVENVYKFSIQLQETGTALIHYRYRFFCVRYCDKRVTLVWFNEVFVTCFADHSDIV